MTRRTPPFSSSSPFFFSSYSSSPPTLRFPIPFYFYSFTSFSTLSHYYSFIHQTPLLHLFILFFLLLSPSTLSPLYALYWSLHLIIFLLLYLFFLHLLLFLFRSSPPSTPLPSILFPLVYILLLLFFFLFLRPFLWLIGLHSLSLHRRSWLCEHGGHFRFWQRKITMNGSTTFSVAAPTLELSSLCN